MPILALRSIRPPVGHCNGDGRVALWFAERLAKRGTDARRGAGDFGDAQLAASLDGGLQVFDVSEAGFAALQVLLEFAAGLCGQFAVEIIGKRGKALLAASVTHGFT